LVALIELSRVQWHMAQVRSAGFFFATCLALQCLGLASTCLAQPVSRISSGGGSALEGAQAVSVTVHRGENQTAAVSVDYSTKDGTAKAGVDYTPASGTLSFAAGETERTISIPLGEDNGLLDGDRWFSFLLTNATGGAVIESSEVKVFIQDNEVPANLDYSFNPVISSEYGYRLLSIEPNQVAKARAAAVASSADK
jgi:hypothetical protein